MTFHLLERDRAGAFSRELWRKCGQMNLLGLPAPESYGGAAADPLTCAIALEALRYWSPARQEAYAGAGEALIRWRQDNPGPDGPK